MGGQIDGQLTDSAGRGLGAEAVESVKGNRAEWGVERVATMVVLWCRSRRTPMVPLQKLGGRAGEQSELLLHRQGPADAFLS